AAMRAEPAIAATTLRAAFSTAIDANLYALAVEAWARREWLEGQERPESAFAGLDFVGAGARRTTPLARALLLHNLGSIQLQRGRRSEARVLFDRAFEEARKVSGPGAVELVVIRRNLGLVVDDPEERAKVLDGAHADLARLLGESHPDTLLSEYFYASL